MAHARHRRAPRDPGPDRFTGLSVGFGLCLVALLLWLDPFAHSDPPARAPRLDSRFTNGATVRTVGEALEFDGDPCSDCHEDMDPPEEDPVHKDDEHEIVLHHGSNDRCFNCHHPVKRDFFVDYHGGTIPFKDVVLLCAKCHGPHYRDWESGAHGRRTGYWNPKAGKQMNTPCIACHDPHWPVFKPIEAAPPPRRLHAKADPARHEEVSHHG